MIKLFAYTDGTTDSVGALRFAAELKKRLQADLAVITVRSGTDATEEPPPVGVDIPLAERRKLTKGLRILAEAVDVLTDAGLFGPQNRIRIRDVHQGHVFVCTTPSGEKVPFYERFGHFIEVLNEEVSEHGYTLLLVSPPRRTGVSRLITGDATRKLALDLHTSVLVVRGGGPDSRFLVCTDGSPSAHRQFPLLKGLLPAIRGPVDLIWVKDPDAGEESAGTAERCLPQAGAWLKSCGKHVTVHRPEGKNTGERIVEVAGDDSVISMGASLRHDVYRRMLGSLPMQVLSKTRSSVLLVKLLPESDSDFFEDPFTC